EVVLQAGRLSRREHLLPIDGVFAERESASAALTTGAAAASTLSGCRCGRFLRCRLGRKHARAGRLHALLRIDALQVCRDEAATMVHEVHELICARPAA